MILNYLKGLTIATLFCSLCVNAGVIAEMTCSDIVTICSSCIQNSYGHVIELVLKENIQVEEGFFSSFNYLEKLTFTGEQRYIEQYHLQEISYITTLLELYLESSVFTSSQYNMNIFENSSSLSVLEVAGINYFEYYSESRLSQSSSSDFRPPLPPPPPGIRRGGSRGKSGTRSKGRSRRGSRGKSGTRSKGRSGSGSRGKSGTRSKGRSGSGSRGRPNSPSGRNELRVNSMLKRLRDRNPLTGIDRSSGHSGGRTGVW